MLSEDVRRAVSRSGVTDRIAPNESLAGGTQGPGEERYGRMWEKLPVSAGRTTGKPVTFDS
ncbi:protein of unknown function [Nitrospira japonica]|uniref:Uncharacterized protein n=1 Tax=Nitrospira japonica TaxID=1325564 RepID=A0A1W1I5F1_9BACT|nr:protein of unknown function [Nitrospira japonica]